MLRRPLTKESRLSQRAAFYPEEKYGKPETFERLTIYRYEMASKFLALVFNGTAANPLYHYSYATLESREKGIERMKESEKMSADYREKRKAERLAVANTLQVGDILYDSWGYDQTNIDFYQVVKRTDKRVWVRRIAEKETRSAGWLCEYVAAQKDHFLEGEPEMVSPTKYSKWDGRELYQSHYA